MAKHKRREQQPVMNDNNMNNNNNNNPFGIDPAQLMGLLGGNIDMNAMGNMLASMNTNGFNLGNLGPIAKMAGLNLGNNFQQENRNNNAMNGNINMHPNSMNGNFNMGQNMNYSNNSNPNVNYKNQTQNEKNSKNTVNNNGKDNPYDSNLEFLMSLRSFAHPNRIKFIDRMIELYKSGAFKDI